MNMGNVLKLRIVYCYEIVLGEIKQNVLNSYRDDMVKYAEVKDKTKIKECFK